LPVAAALAAAMVVTALAAPVDIGHLFQVNHLAAAILLNLH
jgi:hypothetical protein